MDFLEADRQNSQTSKITRPPRRHCNDDGNCDLASANRMDDIVPVPIEMKSRWKLILLVKPQDNSIIKAWNSGKNTVP